jgi:hypothetical protein
MNPLSFLSQVTVVAVESVKKPAARVAKQWQPLTADLRIWSSGAVFPSADLIAEFSLEYTNKNTPEVVANGIDIIDIAEMAAISTPQRFIAMSVTAKSESRIDLFGITRYAEDGTPTASVAEQGSATFGKEYLLPLLKEVYGVEPNEEGFIDLNIVRSMPFTSANGIFRFPKLVSRGAQKGEVSYVRRENQTVYALVVVETPTGDQPADTDVAGEVDHELHSEMQTKSTSEHQAVLLDDSEQRAEIEDAIAAEDNPFSGSETPVFTAAAGVAK